MIDIHYTVQDYDRSHINGVVRAYIMIQKKDHDFSIVYAILEISV